MIKNNEPYLIEYNVRMVILNVKLFALLKNDLADLIKKCVDGK